jgi:hypothetical protein
MVEVLGTIELRESFLLTVVRAFRVRTRSLAADACLRKLHSGDRVVKVVDEEEALVQLHLVAAAAPTHRKGPSSYLPFVEWCDRG